MTTHPHLEGLIRALREQWAQRELDLLDLSDDDCAEICGDVVRDLDTALAALPGGGVDEETKS